VHLPRGDPALGTAGDTDGEESERGLCQVGGYRLRLERRSAALFLCVCKSGKCLHGVRGRAVAESLQRRAQQRRLRVSPRLHGREQGASHAASRRTVRARHPVDNAPDGGKRQAHCLRCIPPPRAACVRAAASDLHDRAAWLRETLISGASHPQGLRLVAKRRGAA
jgi:hypothetical protein